MKVRNEILDLDVCLWLITSPLGQDCGIKIEYGPSSFGNIRMGCLKNEDSGRLKEHSYIFIPNNSSMTFVAGKQTCNFFFFQF